MMDQSRCVLIAQELKQNITTGSDFMTNNILFSLFSAVLFIVFIERL